MYRVSDLTYVTRQSLIGKGEENCTMAYEAYQGKK